MTRRRQIARLLAVPLLITLGACSDTTSVVYDHNLLLRQIGALGFRTDMVEDRGDHYIVEYDIVLTKAYLRELARRSFPDSVHPQFQYYTTELVSAPTKIHAITVDISDLASHPDWQSAVIAALDEWSSVPYSYVSIAQGSPADITFRLIEEAGTLAGRSKFPESGLPGDTIWLNKNFSASADVYLTECGSRDRTYDRLPSH